MIATRLLRVALTFTTAAACLSITAQASSPATEQSLDRSAIARYERTLNTASLRFGSAVTQQSTAFLIDNGNDAAPALLVGSGHAVFKRPQIAGGQLAGLGRVTFESVAGAAFDVVHTRYASRRGLDFAVFELQQTQGALKALGIMPMVLAGRQATEGETITVGARVSGVTSGSARWPTQELVRVDLKTGRGFLQRHLLLMEDAWLQPGDSGSPVVEQAAGAVLAVAHSSNPLGSEASDLSFLPACLNNGAFDVNAAGCGLSNQFDVALDEEDERMIYKVGSSAMVISQVLYATTTLYQTKLAQWPDQCEQGEGYGPVQQSGSPINVPIEGFTLAPENPTVLALCVWGREAAGPEPANRNALALPVVVHPAGPASQPELEIDPPYKDRKGRNAYLVSVEPEQILLRRVELKSGPWDTTDCADESGYRALAGTRKEAVTEDTRLCAVGVDYAGQRSQPLETKLLP